MAITEVSRPLISLALPQDRTSRRLMQVAAVLAGTALLALAARVTVPFWPVPMTLQVLAVFLIGAAYGRDLALATLLLYLAQGAAGLPVFALGAGPGYMAGPTGGYLIGFVVAAGIAGRAADRGLDREPFRLFLAMLAGEAAILGLGAMWLAWLFGVQKAISWGIGPFIVTDLVKVALAAAIVPAAWSIVARLRR
ncbi:MAG TPA: biotin transporter BioY [Rhizobiaceae bacterium]|nr:biotin transporter BioY [Rhizobiaceae bacterium]